MAAFIAEHNISFLTSDHMVPLSKSMFADSEIAKSMKCSRTKVTAIITNVIGAQQKDNVASLLNKHPFALCLDESTDVSAEKSLSVVVRVCYNNKVRDCFFDLVRVRNADAQGIYDSVVKIFQNKNIDYKTNLISFAADGANVMTGSRHSVATMLKKDCPNLIVLKCICHSFALCASYACEKLPASVESFARDVYNFIQNSPKNIYGFADIQSLIDYKPVKMLHPSQTRWFSLEAVLLRLLDRYDCLKIYFNFVVNVDNMGKAKPILNALNDPLNELFLSFLSFILPVINNINRLFQSEKPTIHILYSKMERLVKTI